VSFNFPSEWNLTTEFNDGSDSSQGIDITLSPNIMDDKTPFFEVSLIPNPQDMSVNMH